MSAEADALCGAGFRERSDERVKRRDGYRERELDTRVGGVFGSMGAGTIVDTTGSYAVAYAVAAALCMFAAGVSLVTRPPAPKMATVVQHGRLRDAA